MKKILAWFLIIQSISLLVVGLYSLYLQQAPAQLAFNNYTYLEKYDQRGLAPDKITISLIGINLPVFQASIINKVWPTSAFGAEYLTSSPLPGSVGNSIIYAHDWRSLFGPLYYVKVGDKVVVSYPDKTSKTFLVAYTSTVTPNQSTILAPSKDRRITLYTCIGFLDSHRFVAVAILKS
jgi:LPXTG-site transpeptidase (sortase) family protein